MVINFNVSWQKVNQAQLYPEVNTLSLRLAETKNVFFL